MATNRQAASSSSRWRAPLLFAVLAGLFVLEGTVRNSLFSGSWNTSLAILNMGLISAITALGVNMQWGYAGLFNVGVVGYLVPAYEPGGLMQLLGTEYKFAVSFVILIVVLLFRPTGLFRGKSV